MIKRSVVTLGVFDGVHVGHQAVIKKTVASAKTQDARSVVITFDPHPLKVLTARPKAPSILSLRHRVRLIKALGADKVMVLKFTKGLAGLSAEEFIRRILIKKFGMKEICVSDNFYFGKGARAGLDALKDEGRKFGFKITVVRPIRVKGLVVSSTHIRHLIVTGELEEASRLLARPVIILGTVVGGSRLARKLGYPTANVDPHHEAIPPSGVYAVRVKFAGRLYGGVLNISKRAIEVHIFDFHKKIYGRDLEIIFVKKIRPEKKFKYTGSLISQIKYDERKARVFLKI